MLLFDETPYRDVVCLGLILDGDGQKMSKSKGNIVVPWDVIDRFGADAFRWYFFTSKQPWDGYRFSFDAVGESVRLFLRQLWNTYAFLTTYAPEREGEQTDLDRWALSRLAATVEEVTERLDAFDATTAGRSIAAFVDDLSNWYVRRSRRRFWDGDGAAFATLRECLVTVVAAARAVHAVRRRRDLRQPRRDAGLGASDRLAGARAARRRAGGGDGDRARDGAASGSARGRARRSSCASRCTRRSSWPPGRERDAIERLSDIVREELNVRELRFVEAADELGSYEIKPNYRTLGPRFGKSMPQVAAAVAALDAAHVAATLRRGGRVGVNIDGHEHELGSDDLLLAMRPLEGYQLEREGSHAVALELAIDDELRREGLAREVVHAVQGARKAAGLAVEDRIAWCSAATRSCSTPRARTRATSPARCWPSRWASTGPATARRRRSRAASCASRSHARNDSAQASHQSSRGRARIAPIRSYRRRTTPTRGGRDGRRAAARRGRRDPAGTLDELRRRVRRGGRRAAPGARASTSG